MGSGGRVYPQRRRILPADADELPPADANVCVFPTAEQLASLVSLLRQQEGGDGAQLAVVSVGCGEGYLEGQLLQRGVGVTGVDLDRADADGSERQRQSFAQANCFCGEIRRVRPHELLQLPAEGEGHALLFCFGKRCPLERYLAANPRCRLVLIAGTDDGVTSPRCDALAADSRWSVALDMPVRAVTAGARLVGYARRACTPALPAPAADKLSSKFWTKACDSSSSSEDESDDDESDPEPELEPEPEPEPEPKLEKSPQQKAHEAARMSCADDIAALLTPNRRLRGVAVRPPCSLLLSRVGLTPLHVTVLLEHLCAEAREEGGGWVRRLRTIDLSCNPIADDGVAMMASTLHLCCPHLRSLNIRGVSARTQGALSWARALKAGLYPELCELDLEETNVALQQVLNFD